MTCELIDIYCIIITIKSQPMPLTNYKQKALLFTKSIHITIIANNILNIICKN